MQQTTLGSACVAATRDLFRRFVDAPIVIEDRDTSVVLHPRIEGGFAVSVYDEGDLGMIASERWHAHYDDPEQIAFCAMWLFTPFYRVVQEFKGGLIAAAWLERYEAEGWSAFEPAYFLNPEQESEWADSAGGWTRRRYQQFVMSPPWPYDQIVPGAKLEAGLPIGAAFGETVEQSDFSIGASLY